MPRPVLLGSTLVALLGLVCGSLALAGEHLNAAAIKSALCTAAPEEDGFVDKVVTLGQEGKIPASLVDSSFQWARTKPEHKFQYFKRAVEARAKQQGIDINALSTRREAKKLSWASRLWAYAAWRPWKSK